MQLCHCFSSTKEWLKLCFSKKRATIIKWILYKTVVEEANVNIPHMYVPIGSSKTVLDPIYHPRDPFIKYPQCYLNNLHFSGLWFTWAAIRQQRLDFFVEIGKKI